MLLERHIPVRLWQLLQVPARRYNNGQSEVLRAVRRTQGVSPVA